jgi:hypothetical protein
VLGFDGAAGGDEVFAQLVLARSIEPTSKLDSARVPGLQQLLSPFCKVRRCSGQAV